MKSSPVHRLTLKPGRDASVHRRHPWIFSGALEPPPKEVGEGDLVEVASHDGKILALGHFSPSSIAVKILSFNNQKIDEKFWKQALGRAIDLRQKLGLFSSTSTTAFRLCHAEADGLPGLVVDWYAGTAVIDCQSKGMRNTSEQITQVLCGLLGSNMRAVYVRGASNDEPGSYLFGALESNIILENGFKFSVDWERGQKTGFFLDQRENRKILSTHSRGSRVLNAFSYTGAFSVYAYGGGAKHVTSVDSSKPALERLAANIALNFPKMSTDSVEADCLDYLQASEGNFDVIVVDPPAFVKHRNALEQGIKGYTKLNQRALKAVAPRGLLFTFSCSQLVDRDTFSKILSKASLLAGRTVRILYSLSQAPCHPVNPLHPEGEYLKGFVAVVD